MRTSKIFVTVDAVIFRKVSDDYQILFVQRKNDPYKVAGHCRAAL
jgi:8-oxo-dGTP diphosphatase